ncbi:MAG TPA: protein TolQ [Stellaceae bacterium]|nr:protein TolQ [Stellaceae bacterium]
MNEAASPLSVVTLFLNADPVVKGVMILLFAASVWSWGVIIDKLFNLGRASRIARGYEERAAAARDARDLVVANEADGEHPLRNVLAAGFDECAQAADELETPGERRDRIERAMRLALNGELRRLEQRLPFLATLGSAAPFIGLFGTVWGIMHSFASIAAANNTSLAVVAPGIAEALFATAMGLAAAIPAVVAYNKFTVEIGRFSGRMQGLIGRSGALLCRPV